MESDKGKKVKKKDIKKGLACDWGRKQAFFLLFQ